MDKLLVIISSTGGPRALQKVIPKLPKGIDCGIIVVQHMPAGFTNTLAEHLNTLSVLEVKEVAHEEVMKTGIVYIAKGGYQTKLVKSGKEIKLILTDDKVRNGLKPCADILLESLTEINIDEITCVLLTGMGNDATKGLMELKEKRNVHVIAQSRETCMIYGIPKAANEAGVVDEIVPLEDITEALKKAKR